VDTEISTDTTSALLIKHVLHTVAVPYVLIYCRMDRVIAAILVLLVAFMMQYLWQYYRTMTGEDGVVIAVDVTEPVTHRDEPQVVSVQVGLAVTLSDSDLTACSFVFMNYVSV